MASARAMATRCCWPPESWLGIVSLLVGEARPCSSSSMARASASPRLRPSTATGASMTLRSTVICGKRLKLWNTMPTLPRIWRRCLSLAWNGPPPLRLVIERAGRRSSVPSWNGSSVIRMRSTVDLPEPDGPISVTFSPGATVKSKLVEDRQRAEALADVVETDDRCVVSVIAGGSRFWARLVPAGGCRPSRSG